MASIYKSIISKNQLENIIGLPPLSGVADSFDGLGDKEDKLITASLPLLRIMPAISDTEGDKAQGLHLFSLNHTKGAARWRSIIENSIPPGLPEGSILSPPINRNYIDVCYLNETSITESFSSEYGSSRFEEVANMGSEALREIRTITGSDSAGEGISKVAEHMTGLSSMLSPLLKGIGEGTTKAEDWLASKGMGRLLSGSRIDFPAIWKGSNYSSSHTITIRLYNPNPGSEFAYYKSILQPLLWLLALVTPKNDSDTQVRVAEDEIINVDKVEQSLTYFAPVLCSVKCPGLWEIRAGYVSSIEVIKGGENNDVSFKNRPGMVDVRVSFGELYNVVSTRDAGKADRPTLLKYMSNLTDSPEADLEIFGGYKTTVAAPEDVPDKNAVGSGIQIANNINRTKGADKENVDKITFAGILSATQTKIGDTISDHVEHVKSSL